MDIKFSAFSALASISITSTALAQQTPALPEFPRRETPAQPTPSVLPSQPDPLPTTPTTPPTPTEPSAIDQINVLRYEVLGSTVFSAQELAQATRPFTGKVTFAEIQGARNAINELYLKRQYLTSGAYIPTGQVLTIEGAVVKIQVIEGRLEDIKVTGTQRLNVNYVRSRLALATQQPLNNDQLIEGLRLLQQDPLIETISAELSAGVQPGTNLLEVKVRERPTWSSELAINNNRSASIGSLQRRIQASQANLTGLGDSLTAAYGNTDGSNALDFSYTVPLSPYQTTLTLAAGGSDSQIIEEPFRSLDFRTSSRYYEVAVRHPLERRAGPDYTQELAISLTASKQESSSTFDGGVPALLGRGTDVDGRTNVAAVRLGQEFVRRDSRSVLALRSQLSLGLEALGSTVNPISPDGRFVSWQGQGRWLQRLAANTDLVVQGRVQLADRPLPSLEQFAIGGQTTVRGYRQDRLVADNGAFASVELQVPVLQSASDVVQVAPFVDGGTVWNNDNTLNGGNTLLSAGVGLQWRRENLTARLDWGIPLVNSSGPRTTLQENGLYFSLRYFP